MAAGADRHEQVAGHQRAVNALHGIGHFAKPDDVGPLRAMCTAGGTSRTVDQWRVPVVSAVACQAPGTFQRAMHVDQVATARTLVEIVDILRHQQHIAGKCAFQPNESIVRGIRRHAGQCRPS